MDRFSGFPGWLCHIHRYPIHNFGNDQDPRKIYFKPPSISSLNFLSAFCRKTLPDFRLSKLLFLCDDEKSTLKGRQERTGVRGEKLWGGTASVGSPTWIELLQISRMPKKSQNRQKGGSCSFPFQHAYNQKDWGVRPVVERQRLRSGGHKFFWGVVGGGGGYYSTMVRQLVSKLKVKNSNSHYNSM